MSNRVPPSVPPTAGASRSSTSRTSRLTPLPKVDPRLPLSLQLRQIRKRRDLKLYALEHETRASRATVRRALAPQPHPTRHVNPVIAMHIGVLLGFAPEYLALAFIRDECRYYPVDVNLTSQGQRKSGGRPLSDLTRERTAIADHLDTILASMNPFASSGLVKRLAFRALRLEMGLSRAEAARRIAPHEKLSTARMGKYLRAYEGGLSVFREPRIRTWCDALAEAGAARYEDLGRRLLSVHCLSDTLEVTNQWPPAGSRETGPFPGAQDRLRWYTTRNGQITLSRSPSVIGSLNLEVLTATQPQAMERSPLRCLNAHHPGCELGLVVNGAIRLTVSTQPFEDEAPLAKPRFVVGEGGIVLDRVFREGEVVQFASHLFHRCEFLAPLNRVVSLNLSGSVLLGRISSRQVTAGQPHAGLGRGLAVGLEDSK